MYGYSSLAVLIISVGSIFGVILLPISSKALHEYVMMCFIGLAFGTLAGDAMLHLIPSSLGLHSHKREEDHTDQHEHHHDEIPEYFYYQLGVLGAMYGLFLFELLCNSFSSGNVRQFFC